MNGVIGMTALLLDTELTDEQREYVEATRSSADALLTIINDILDFSKIESGKLELESHPFELHTCIEEALDLLAPKAAEKKLDLAYVVDDTIPKILVSDVTRLRQILVNLVGNAVKFTQQGEVVVEVTPAAHGARAVEPGHEHDTDFLRHPEEWLLHFSVRDTGIGIPLEKQSRLFKSFQQVDASTTRHYGGTGLGLAICKRLTELLGGKIWVESAAEQGATFHFTILTKASSALAPPTWQLQQPQLAGKRSSSSKTTSPTAAFSSIGPRQWGMLVECVGTGRRALALLDDDSPLDAIIIDLQLPDIGRPGAGAGNPRQPSGRGTACCCCCPRCACGATTPAPWNAGVSIFVHKPIRPAQLLDALCRAMNVQLQREKKAPSVPVFDPASRSAFPCESCWRTTIPSTRRWAERAAETGVSRRHGQQRGRSAPGPGTKGV